MSDKQSEILAEMRKGDAYWIGYLISTLKIIARDTEDSHALTALQDFAESGHPSAWRADR